MMEESMALHDSARPKRPPNFNWMGKGSLVQNNRFVKSDPNTRRASAAGLWLEDLKFGVAHINPMGEIIIAPNKYQLMLDVQHFKRGEIHVRASHNAFFIDACHAIPKEGHDYVTEHFSREYVLPRDIQPSEACAFISPDPMVLVVEAPKLPEADAVVADSHKIDPESPRTDDEQIDVTIFEIDDLSQILNT